LLRIFDVRNRLTVVLIEDATQVHTCVLTDATI
jgi:hypothetical protein